MARVNHSEVKKYAQQYGGRINNKGFFTSPMVSGYLEDMAEVITKRYNAKYHVRVKILWDKSNPMIACTDHRIIYINMDSEFINKAVPNKERPKLWTFMLGLFYHELAHLLYTDFRYKKNIFDTMLSKRILLPTPSLPNSINDIISKANIIFSNLYHFLWNAIEDGTIEYRFMSDYPVPAETLKVVREFHYEELNTLREMKDTEKKENGNILFTLINLIFQYAKFNSIKCSPYDKHDERYLFVTSCISFVDEANYNEDNEIRYRAVNNIIVLLEPYLSSYINDRLQEMDTQQLDEDFNNILESIAGQSSDGSQTNASANQKGEDSSPIVIPQKQPTLQQPLSSEEETTSNIYNEDDFELEDQDSKGLNEDSAMDDSKNTSTSSSSNSSNDATDEGEAPLNPPDPSMGEQDYSKLCNEGPLYKKEEAVTNGYDKAASDIERILDSISTEKAEEHLEKEFLKELNSFDKKINHGNIHKGITCKIKRITSVTPSMISQYDQIIQSLKPISRRLEKGIKQILKDKRDGGKLTNLYVGRGIHSPALARDDGKVFYKKKLPCEVPRLAVSLVLDESGSMSSFQRITYARATAIILEEFCRNMDIPLGIYGHTTGDYTDVEINVYADFDSIDRNDRYRLMDIQARNCNRDGYALRYAAERLYKQEAEIKLLIIVSDGSPNDGYYKNHIAFEDLRGIKTEYRRKGIALFAAAIGDDKDVIQGIYGDGYLDISNLEKMPQIMTGLVKRHIK